MIQDQVIPTKMLIDSGNLLSVGLVVSKKFAAENHLKFQPIKSLKIGTADRSGSMAVIGQMINVQIKIGRRVIEQPTVWIIKGLTTPHNP